SALRSYPKAERSLLIHNSPLSFSVCKKNVRTTNGKPHRRELKPLLKGDRKGSLLLYHASALRSPCRVGATLAVALAPGLAPALPWSGSCPGLAPGLAPALASRLKFIHMGRLP